MGDRIHRSLILLWCQIYQQRTGFLAKSQKRKCSWGWWVSWEKAEKTRDAFQYQFWPWFSLFTWKIYFVNLKGLWLSNLKGKWLDLMGLKFLVNPPILWMWHTQQVFTKLKIDSVFQAILRLMVQSVFKNTTTHVVH